MNDALRLDNGIHPPQRRAAPPWALRHGPSHLRLWITAALGLALDLWSKEWAFSRLAPRESRVLVPDVLSLTLSVNPGALFGLGAGFPAVFVGASVLALMFVLYLFANSDARRWSLHVALGCVLAGAVGNLYDRTTHSAYVYRAPGRPADIGVVLGQTDTHVTLGDYPTGGRPRTYPRPENAASGVQPVVRDFIKIELQAGRVELWPWIFNIADALLVLGVGLLLLNFWKEHREHKRGAQE